MNTEINWEAAVRAAERQRADCLIQQRYAEFAAMCSPKLCYVHTSGTVDDLDALMGKLYAGFYVYQAIHYPIHEIRHLGTGILVRADFQADLLVDGQPRKLNNRAVSVWEIENGQLKLAFYQATPIAK
ncbi:nuclear transport factor 2 family protein [Neisseria shayeganii]|uniref:Nuclear transport factor 2 family protein n=1 Tax=Neisseria shayeganii TaxID=607712 RepID=A0A7D7T5K0_9NEIS|nr:nuclear transport factor 2 family protein [Neisseria shayeganii]QMT40293.1 nuclear transport factor 2 family protein [Neisseria shayeganii]